MSSNLMELETEQEAQELDSIASSESVATVRQVAQHSKGVWLSWMRLIAGLSLLIGAFGLGWWASANQLQKQERITLPQVESPYSNDAIIVTASPVTYQSVSRYVEAVGTLHGFEEVTLSSKQEGRVLKVHHDLSSVVAPNELLLELDPTDANLAYQQAERNVQTELAKWGFNQVPSETEDLTKLPTVVSARLKFELAQSRLQRLLPLKRTNSVTAEDLEQSQSDALVFESDWQHQLLMANSAAATARLRNAELAIAQQRVQDLAIRVPIPTLTANPNDKFYTVSERMVSEGTLVRPGTEVFKLVLGRTLKLKLSVPESFSSQVQVGQKVEVTTGSILNPVDGTVARISPSIDRLTRTFLVEVDVNNEDGALKPGGFAKAKILIGVDDQALTIPIAGLYSFAGINKIFLNEQGVARELKVVVGEQTQTWVEITSPSLPAEAMVVTSGQRLLSEGSPIEIRSGESR
jgi:RND family efflux transporter MFP subunit